MVTLAPRAYQGAFSPGRTAIGDSTIGLAEPRFAANSLKVHWNIISA
jgi:hypothetical protein